MIRESRVLRYIALSIDFEPDDNPLGEALQVVRDQGLTVNTTRPGALSYDFLTSYTLGPIHQGDFSAGLANRIWRVRLYDQVIRLARENDGKTGFENEVVLANIPFTPVESDAAFDQAARLFVCVEFSGHVWFYWFKPVLGAFVFEDFGVGHSPRCTLDQLTNRDDSDLHVFYLRDGNLYYRVQRENYAVEHGTNYVGQLTSFIDDVAITKGGRVVALIANVGADGHYYYELTFSKLLPYLSDRESVIEGLNIQSGINVVALFPVGPPYDALPYQDDIEQYHEGLIPQSGILVAPVIFVAPPADAMPFQDDVEQYHEGLTIQSGILVVALILHTLFDIEQYHEGLTINSGILVAIVIVHNLFDIEQYHEGLTIISGTLV